MTWVKWKLILIHLEIVLVTTQDRCMVCAERTIGLGNHFWRIRWYSYVTLVKWELVPVLLEIVLITTQDRYTVCVERTIGLEIILGTPDGTPW